MDNKNNTDNENIVSDAQKESNSSSVKNPDGKDKKNAPAPRKAKPGIFARIAHYFRELKAETKKVVWPTRKQVINNTIVVLIMMVFAGTIIWLIDLAFGQARDFIIKLAGG